MENKQYTEEDLHDPIKAAFSRWAAGYFSWTDEKISEDTNRMLEDAYRAGVTHAINRWGRKPDEQIL